MFVLSHYFLNVELSFNALCNERSDDSHNNIFLANSCHANTVNFDAIIALYLQCTVSRKNCTIKVAI